MARVACVAGPDPGHLLPMAAIAVGLHRSGHDVVLASGGPLLDAIAADGPHVVQLPALAPQPGDHDMAHIIWTRAAAMAPATRDLLAPFRPDLIVTDTITTVGHFVADLLGIPAVEVSPHHLMDPSPAVPPVGLGRAPSDAHWRRWDDANIRRQQWRSLESARRLRTEVRASIGLDPVHGAVRRLLAVPPCLEYVRDDWPDDAIIVGPLRWEPAGWQRLEPTHGTDPLVLVTDTTASGPQQGLAVRAIRALAGAPVRVFATTTNPAAREAAIRAGNAEVGNGSHESIFPLADLAIGPGGGGFVGKAMAHGVPLVVVPGQGDQRETGRRVETAGVGRRVRHGPGFERRLRIACLRTLTDPGYHRRATACAQRCRDLGVPAAVNAIEAVLAGR